MGKIEKYFVIRLKMNYNKHMNNRKTPLVTNQTYHIFNRSIGGLKIFNKPEDYNRFIGMLALYRYQNLTYSYSKFESFSESFQNQVLDHLQAENKYLVEIIAYCVMPNHFHLILKQVTTDGITQFMSRISNSYAKYLNAEQNRLGPLFEGHFKNIEIKNDNYLLHLTRYIHLNPTSAWLAIKPEDWQYSSYKEFLHPTKTGLITPVLDITPTKYQQLMDDQVTYQRQLAKIKSLLIDDLVD